MQPKEEAIQNYQAAGFEIYIEEPYLGTVLINKDGIMITILNNGHAKSGNWLE